MTNSIETRPRIRIQLTPTDWVVEVAAAAVLIFLLLSVARYYPLLPEQIPIHFNLVGQADGWGAKSTVLFLAGMMVMLYAVLTVLSRLPHIGNYPVEITQENAARVYGVASSMARWLKLELLCMCSYLTWMMIQVGLGRAKDLGASALLVFLGMMCATMVVMIVRFYRAK